MLSEVKAWKGAFFFFWTFYGINAIMQSLQKKPCGWISCYPLVAHCSLRVIVKLAEVYLDTQWEYANIERTNLCIIIIDRTVNMPLNKLNKGEINELHLARSPKESSVSLCKSGNIFKPRYLLSLERGALRVGGQTMWILKNRNFAILGCSTRRMCSW